MIRKKMLILILLITMISCNQSEKTTSLHGTPENLAKINMIFKNVIMDNTISEGVNVEIVGVWKSEDGFTHFIFYSNGTNIIIYPYEDDGAVMQAGSYEMKDGLLTITNYELSDDSNIIEDKVVFTYEIIDNLLVLKMTEGDIGRVFITLYKYIELP